LTLRLALIIVCLTSIAVARVHLRRCELLARHDSQELANRQVELRRALWDQQVRMSYLTAPAKVRQQAIEMLGPSGGPTIQRPGTPAAPSRKGPAVPTRPVRPRPGGD
jgi:hypothetical protein